MSILVTGGAGYIGSHTVIELVKNDYEVVIVDNYSNSKPEVLNRLAQIVDHDIPFYEVDILDQAELRKVFEKHEISAVIHFAASKAVGESVEKPLFYYKNNVSGTISLLEVMKEYNVKTFIYSSSATVYGDKYDSPLSESLPVSTASNPYGSTKIMTEIILEDLAKADPDWSIVLLRYFNPIGAHESGLIGEDPQGIPNNIMPYITQVAVGKLPKLNIFGDDYPTKDGTGVRDYIHVVDLSLGHIKALDYALEHKGCEIFNLGTGEGYSVLDLVTTFEKASSREIPYEITERRPGDVAITYADPTKAKTGLHWQTERNLYDMCKDSWNWQEKNPEGL